MNYELRIKSLCCRNGLWILLFTVGIGVYFIGMPYIRDDYWYVMFYRRWFEGQGIFPWDGGNVFKAGIPWEEIWESLAWRYEEDNVRLGNVLAHFLLLVPKWIGSGLMTILVLWSLFYTFCFAGIDWRRSRYVPLVIFMWALAMPWMDNMGSLVFQLNYVLSCWGVFSLYYVLDKWSAQDFGSRAGYWVLAVLLSAFTGLMHEGFALPAFGGLAMLFVLKKGWRKAPVAVCAIILLVCSAMLMSVPGMTLRAGYEVRGWEASLANMPGLLIRGAYAFVAMLALWVVAACRKGVRKKLLDPSMIFFFTAAWVCIAIQMAARAEQRMFYLTEACSIVMVVRLLRINFTTHRKPGGKILRACIAGMLAVSFLALGVLDVYTIGFRRALKPTLARYFNTNDANVYGRAPFETGYDHIFAYNYFLTTTLLRRYLDPDRMKWDPTIIPEQLMHVTAESGIEVGDGTDIRKLDCFFFFEMDEKWRNEPESRYVRYMADMGSGYREIEALLSPFTSLEDGKDYYWLLPKYRGSLFTTDRIRRLKPAE